MRAIYPGSFDPVTNGHLDIVQRAASLFDEVIVAIAPNSGKEPIFTIEERREMLSEVCRDMKNVTVDCFEGLLVEYARNKDAQLIVKGLRAVTDFQFEFEMALTNRRLAPSIETVFLMTGAEYSYLSSSLVKEIAALGGSVQGLAPDLVEKKLKQRLRQAVPDGSGAVRRDTP